jgi:hypothetical protein
MEITVAAVIEGEFSFDPGNIHRDAASYDASPFILASLPSIPSLVQSPSVISYPHQILHHTEIWQLPTS